MDPQKKEKFILLLEKVRSLALVLIGIGFIGKGVTYFSAQISYDVPIILVPVYELLGSVGLAIGICLLGLGFIGFGYRRYKSYQKKRLALK